MAERVSKWADKSGKEYGTKREAEAADARIEIHEWVEKVGLRESTGYLVDAETIVTYAPELAEMLAKYMTLSGPKKTRAKKAEVAGG